MATPKRRIKRTVHRPFDLAEFYRRLHETIGGSGPVGLAWDKELPDSTLDPEAFRTEYLWSEIASKYDPCDRKGAEVRREEALRLFRESEERCARFNRLLFDFGHRSAPLKGGFTLDAVFHTASRKIGRLLGDFCWSECDTHMGFGPGAAFSLPRRAASKWSKFEANLDVNESAVPLALAVLAGRPAWCRSLIEQGGCIVSNPKNRVTTVPKNFKRDRVIAVEPLMGSYIQKGIGGVIRHRLKSVGINLNDQRANQLGALVGSLDGSLATIDLKAASDTISIGVVQQLLPPEWASAIELCRSPFGVLDSGERILYRKCSSMGNAFTFELETLIFWGICSAVLALVGATDRRLQVFGDDIVVPSMHAEAVLAALEGCGFEQNPKKTHVDGPFRESCGKHYLSGNDVTPFYIRRPVRDAGELFLLHNNLSRWLSRGFVCDSIYRRSYDGKAQALLEWIRLQCPLVQKPTICDGYGDDGFIGSFDEVVPQFKQRGVDGLSHEHFSMRFWPERVNAKAAETSGMLPASLAMLDALPDRDCASPPDGDVPTIRRVVAGKRVRRILRIPLRGWNEPGIWA